MTIAERNRSRWPDLMDDHRERELITRWVGKSLEVGKADYVEFSGSSVQGIWETEQNDEIFAPSKESYAKMLEKVMSY